MRENNPMTEEVLLTRRRKEVGTSEISFATFIAGRQRPLILNLNVCFFLSPIPISQLPAEASKRHSAERLSHLMRVMCVINVAVIFYCSDCILPALCS